jgi:hypothetical protein
MTTILLYWVLWCWLQAKINILDYDQHKPCIITFANVGIVTYHENVPIARTSYHNGTHYAFSPFASVYLTPLDTPKRVLRMQKQDTIPQLARVRLNANRVSWHDNECTIDGFKLSREQKTAKSGNRYTVGYWHNGIRYERLRDMLNHLEQMYVYKRGARAMTLSHRLFCFSLKRLCEIC